MDTENPTVPCCASLPQKSRCVRTHATLSHTPTVDPLPSCIDVVEKPPNHLCWKNAKRCGCFPLTRCFLPNLHARVFVRGQTPSITYLRLSSVQVDKILEENAQSTSRAADLPASQTERAFLASSVQIIKIMPDVPPC